MYLLSAVNVDESSNVSDHSLRTPNVGPLAPPASGYSIAHLMASQLDNDTDTGKRRCWYAHTLAHAPNYLFQKANIVLVTPGVMCVCSKNINF